jgi:hypothetical protein
VAKCETINSIRIATNEQGSIFQQTFARLYGSIPKYRQFHAVRQNFVLSRAEQKRCIVSDELFLDVEHGEDELVLIVGENSKIGISPSALDDILGGDAFSIIRLNLILVAGEWVSFNEKWLLD